jgi:hypothetical protein
LEDNFQDKKKKTDAPRKRGLPFDKLKHQKCPLSEPVEWRIPDFPLVKLNSLRWVTVG